MGERRRKLIVRWSIVTAGVIALFWAIWYLVNGSVPVVTSITMTESWTYALPFGISRWWDVLIGPIWSTSLILLLTNKRLKGVEDLDFGLVFGLAVILVFGLAVGLVYGLAVGLVYGLVAGLVVGLVYGLFAGLAVGLFAGLAVGLVFGLAVGLAVGLVYGLVAGLAVGLAVGLVYGLVTLLVDRQFWTKAWNWLLVR